MTQIPMPPVASPPMVFLPPGFVELYRKYDEELRILACRLRGVYHMMQRRGYGATFGDVEGECMYVVIRESRPDVVFEISPNAGWSTNYILAALTANQKGVCHSFELLPRIGGEPTEQAIRRNQHRGWDQRQLRVHIGDARMTVKEIEGAINFLLLDSCHEAWFAEWYIEALFPRVGGYVMIQDIAFVDEMERSSEARHIWAWAQDRHIRLYLLGAVEVELERRGCRLGYAERRGLRSNAVLFPLPSPSRGEAPELADSPEALVAQAEAEVARRGRPDNADRLLNEAVFRLLRDPTRANRHRAFVRAGSVWERLGSADEAARAYQRALGGALQADLQQRRKGLLELVKSFARLGRWRLAAQAAVLLVWQPGGFFALLKSLIRLGRAVGGVAAGGRTSSGGGA